MNYYDLYNDSSIDKIIFKSHVGYSGGPIRITIRSNSDLMWLLPISSSWNAHPTPETVISVFPTQI